MRYGIFGGAFDPIHLGHLLLAESCREHAALDQVLFVPTGVSPHRQGKGQYQASPEERCRMVELAISGNDAFELCRFEAERPEVSYTVETLWYLIENESVPSNPEERFLILGADMFNDFPHWKDAKTLAKMITPLVAFRPDFEKPAFEKYAELAGPEAGERCRRLAVPMPQIEISSSQIRRNILKGKSIRYMVSDPVEREIRKNGLYRETSTR